MKGLFSFIAIACLATVLFLRFTGRIGDHRSTKEQAISNIYAGMRDGMEVSNAEFEARHAPIRLYSVTRSNDRITLVYTLADTRLAGAVKRVDSAVIYEFCKIGVRRSFDERHLKFAELLVHRAELSEVEMTVRYDDLHDKTLNSANFNLATILEESSRLPATR